MRGRQVLVVDDDDSLRRITQMQLEEAGYEVAARPGRPGGPGGIGSGRAGAGL